MADSERAPARATPTAFAQQFRFVRHAAAAQVHYRGLLVDLGSPSSRGRLGPWALVPDPNVVDVEHDGATWAKVLGRSISVEFALPEDAPSMTLGVRVRGGTARTMTPFLDGKASASIRLLRGEMRVLATHLAGTSVSAGLHTLTLRFGGGARTSGETMAEIDWIRLGSEGDEAGSHAAPTMNELVVDAALSGLPHRSIALRAPAEAEFVLLVSKGARFRSAIGFEGVGSASAEVDVAPIGGTFTNLVSTEATGGDHAQWKPVDAGLDDFAGQVVSVRLRARQATPGGRVLFGDPVVALPDPPIPSWPEVRAVVILLLSGVDRPHLLSPAHQAINELDRTGVSFEGHRIPTTVSAAVLSSLLTSLPPREHTLEDGSARLPDSLTTLAAAARDGSVQAAMFTGCPSTFSAFGFARGWDKYAAYSPVEGAPAVAPITEATQWLATHLSLPDAKALVVVHARGGHPPWDVTQAEAAKLAPVDYSGSMEPRRSAQIIGRARMKRSRFRLTENDRTRMWAIYDEAMIGHDRAIGDMIEALKRQGLWDKTVFVLGGDTGMLAESRAPFGDGEELSEAALSVPLWVRFPKGLFAGTRIRTPTDVVDISKTVLDALHLGVREDFNGYDLLATAAGAAVAGGRPQWATLGPRFALRLGDLVLTGMAGRQPLLCDLSVDASCELDKAEKAPVAAMALWRTVFEAEERAQKLRKRSREPATVDPDTAAALNVWGE